MPLNARTVTHQFQKWIFYHRIFRLFGGATEGFKICARFVGSMIFVYSCRRLVFEALRYLDSQIFGALLIYPGLFFSVVVSLTRIVVPQTPGTSFKRTMGFGFRPFLQPSELAFC